MSLDDRGITILNIIVDNPAITGSQIEKELSISRKQLSYSLEKINYYLIENGYEEIKRLKTGRFVLSNELIQAFKSEKHEINNKDYILSEQERLNLITLALLVHKETLMINDFTYSLKISKNTVLSDLKKLQSLYLDNYDLKVMYERQTGYYIVGKEYEKRNLMIKMVNNILSTLYGETVLLKTLEVNEEKIKNLKEDVEEIEKSLNARYTDERLKEIPYILYFILRRIESNKILDYLPEDYHHIVGTSEYNNVMKIFEKYNIVDTIEKMYLVSLFQVSSVKYDSNRESEKELQLVVDQVLSNFETLVCVKFDDRDALLDALLQHIKPAIYRIKYNYHIESNILNMILPMHQSLFELTKHSMKPLEEMINKPFSDEEIAYITILFGGWLTKSGSLDFIESKKIAIVVCTNGISISNFLFIKLKEAFPEFYFLSSMSLREFYEFEQDYHMVFSTVNLDCEKPQFFVKPIMDDYDIQILRGKVFNKLIDKTIHTFNSTKLIQIIEKYTDIKDIKGLIGALKVYFGETIYEVNKEVDQEKASLNDLLSLDNITVLNKCVGWEEAIDIASKPLLDKKIINKSYIDSMKEEIVTSKPYWGIADGLILAHSGVDKGVNKLGISLLKLPKDILINGYLKARVIIVIATPNRNAHLRALNELIEITENRELLQMIKDSKDSEEIYKLI